MKMLSLENLKVIDIIKQRKQNTCTFAVRFLEYPILIKRTERDN